MKIIGITQARIGSSRLPSKVLLKINNITLLEYHLTRAKQSRLVDKWIVATTDELGSDDICAIARKLSIDTYKGNVNDVLDRFYQASKNENSDYIVRITSDCPLIDPELIDIVIDRCIAGNFDYFSNTLEPTFPDGVDVEIFRFSALEKAWNEAELSSEREHVTSYIWKKSTFLGNSLFYSGNYRNSEDLSFLRMTVDEKADYELVEKLIKALGSDKKWALYSDYLRNNSYLLEMNSNIKRNEGYIKSTKNDVIMLRDIKEFAKSEEYRKKIHNLIPGGGHTYSKGDDQFPKIAPAAIGYAKGAYVWDIDGNKFLDCSMGLTSVSLGHAYEPVIDRVKHELDSGVNFQRPSYLEMEMAELFLSLVPQHQMIKFAKNGSIVTTAAVKLARAFTGRKLVAFPGDHPFYSYDDWFIGRTACNKGVPEEISELSVTFKSCNIDSLVKLFEENPGQIACVIMEPEKNLCNNGCSCSMHIGEYLKQAIQLTQQNGALFIMDEMVTGFKTEFPGSMKKYNLEPDMATWGKGIANGFSFCALTGKKEVMELGGITRSGSEKVFLISTTHGGETHTMAAAIATINEFQKHDVLGHNHSIGKQLIKLCQEIIKENELTDYIQVTTSEWMPLFLFKDEQKQISAGFRTLALQEMIKRGVLFQGIFTPCFSHTKEDIEYFAAAFKEMVTVYKSALKIGYSRLLIGEPIKPVFRKII